MGARRQRRDVVQSLTARLEMARGAARGVATETPLSYTHLTSTPLVRATSTLSARVACNVENDTSVTRIWKMTHCRRGQVP